MPIDVRCECGKEYQVDESKIGKRGQCKCGRAMLIEAQPAPPPVRAGYDRVIPIKATHVDTMDGLPTRSPKINGYYWSYRQVRDNRSEDMPDGQSSRDLVARTKAAKAKRKASGIPEPPITRETSYGDVVRRMKESQDGYAVLMAELQIECDRLNAENTEPGRIYRVAVHTVSLNGKDDGKPCIVYQKTLPRAPGARVPGTYSKRKPKGST